MKRVILLFCTAVCTFTFGLSGCGQAEAPHRSNTAGLGYIAYTDIDSVCENPELMTAGANLLSAMEGQLLLSYVIDSSIELGKVLGDYDHLILTNPQWIQRFGEIDSLQPVAYESLSGPMRDFLDAQMAVLTADGSVLPEGTGLYRYEGGKLLAFPVNVTLGLAEPLEAERPLIILIEQPAQALRADSCLLPLTSTGNLLFAEAEELRVQWEGTELSQYGTVQVLGEGAGGE